MITRAQMGFAMCMMVVVGIALAANICLTTSRQDAINGCLAVSAFFVVLAVVCVIFGRKQTQ